MKVKHAGCIKLRCDFKILSCELSAWNKVNNPVTSPLTCFRSKYKNFLEEVMSLLNIKCLQLTDILVLKYTIEIPKFLYIHVTKKRTIITKISQSFFAILRSIKYSAEGFLERGLKFC